MMPRFNGSFLRFCLTGIVFTLLGPGLFWLAYPLGPFVAVVIAELSVHCIRFFTFRAHVFTVDHGYRVTLSRYVASALPVSFTGFASVALLHQHLNRTTLTMVTASIALVVGFLWSRYVYSRPHH